MLSFPLGKLFLDQCTKSGEAALPRDSTDLAGFHGCNGVFGPGLNIPFNLPLVTPRLSAKKVHTFLCFNPVKETQRGLKKNIWLESNKIVMHLSVQKITDTIEYPKTQF